MGAIVRSVSKGSVAVEFMVMVPVLIIIMFGLIQLGSVFYMRQQLLNVAYNGLHYAATNKSATNASVNAYIEQQLTGMGVSATKITLTPSDITVAERGTPLSVVVSVSANSLAILSFPISFGQMQISVSSSMAKQF